MRVEQVILKQLINNEEYTRKVIPFLFKDYFADTNEQIVFEKIKEFINNYNKIPTKEALVVELDNDKTLNDDQFQHCGKIVNELLPSENFFQNNEKKNNEFTFNNNNPVIVSSYKVDRIYYSEVIEEEPLP